MVQIWHPPWTHAKSLICGRTLVNKAAGFRRIGSPWKVRDLPWWWNERRWGYAQLEMSEMRLYPGVGYASGWMPVLQGEMRFSRQLLLYAGLLRRRDWSADRITGWNTVNNASVHLKIWIISKRVGVILRVRGVKGSRIRVKYPLISASFKFKEGYRPCIWRFVYSPIHLQKTESAKG